MRFDYILIVAGPSGAGKSTFMENLKARRLGFDIARVLPEQAWTWPARVARKQRENMLAGKVSRSPGIVMHVDTTNLLIRPEVGDALDVMVGAAHVLSSI